MTLNHSPQHSVVLLVEDNPGDARLLRAHLADVPGQPFDLIHTTTLTQALSRIAQGRVDLVLLDLSLPDSKGLETFRAANAAAPEVPIIVLSGLEDEGLAIQTVHEGAQDYLNKRDLDSRLLARAIKYSIERKQVEDALAHERDLFYTIFDNVPDRIFIKDLESRFLKANRSLTTVFGLADPRELIGKSDSDFFTSEHAGMAFQDEQQILRTGVPILDKVERETLPGGGFNWVITSKLPLRDKQGRLIGTCGISRDITALKNAEQALSAERNLLRNLIDNIPDYIYAKDRDCLYTLDNEAHRRFLGVTRVEEIMTKRAADFPPSELSREYDSEDKAIVRTGHPLVNHEEPAIDRVGNQRWHSTTKIPLRDSEGVVSPKSRRPSPAK